MESYPARQANWHGVAAFDQHDYRASATSKLAGCDRIHQRWTDPKGMGHRACPTNQDIEKFLANMRIKLAHFDPDFGNSDDDESAFADATVAIYYVLRGTGHCVHEQGRMPFGPDTTIVATTGTRLEFLGSETSHATPGADRQVGHFCNDAIAASDRLAIACVGLAITDELGLSMLDGSKCPASYADRDGRNRQLVEFMITETANLEVGVTTALDTLSKNLFLRVLRDNLREAPPGTWFSLLFAKPQIARVANAVEQAPAERHTVESMARLAGMAPSSLARQFEEIFARSPIEFVKHVRLTAAVALLRETNLPIKTIAGMVGFASRSHFSRLFSQVLGQDPTAFRRSVNGPEGDE